MKAPPNPCLKPKAFSHLAFVQFNSFVFRFGFAVQRKLKMKACSN